jgi:hypothetical protein
MAAGVVYENYNGVHCSVSIAAATGSGWADPGCPGCQEGSTLERVGS